MKRLFNNKGFFMPCVMAYTLIFISFVSWQVTEVIDYQYLSLSLNQQAQYEAALYAASEYTIDKAESNFEYNCIEPFIPTNNSETKGYSIEYNAYCVREPNTTQIAIPGDVDIKPMFAYINNLPTEVDEEEFNKAIVAVNNIVATELAFEWIGLPVDAVPTLLDAAQYATVLDMPCIMFMQIKITTENKTQDILVKYNLRTQKTEKVIHT